MAEPTLNDVLKAIAEMRGEVTTKSDLAKGLAGVRSEMTTKSDLAKGLAAVRSEMNERFDRVDQQLVELDRDLTAHMDVHRELEKDVEALKRRPLRAAARPARRRGSTR